MYTWANKDVFTGNFRCNKKEGPGILKQACGDKLDAIWKDDKINGKGILTRKNGDKYVGDWVDNKIEGKGKSI